MTVAQTSLGLRWQYVLPDPHHMLLEGYNIVNIAEDKCATVDYSVHTFFSETLNTDDIVRVSMTK